MDIVEELRQDREKGARRLEAEYKAGLMTLARRFCHDEGDAEELVNRTFAAVVSGIDDYLEKSAFFAWMCQIMTNIHTVDVRRLENKIILYPGDVPEVADTSSAERIYEEVDASLLREAVHKLPKESRELLVLHYFLDIPIPKIAKILAVPAGTVKSRLHYARKALVAKLGVAAHKPGGKAVILALLLSGLTALGAATWNFVVSGESQKNATEAGTSRVASRVSSSAMAEDVGQATGDARQTEASNLSTSSNLPQSSLGVAGSLQRGAEGGATSTTQGVNMNKTTLLAASAAIMAASATMPVGAYETVTTNGVIWKYIMNDDGVNTVTLGPGGGSGNAATDEERAILQATSVSASLIPWTFEKDGVTYTVTKVNDRAFYNCTGLTGTLTIPDAVKEVGDYAFEYIGASVTRVASLGGITKVGTHAFDSITPLGDFPDIYNITSFGGTATFKNWTKITGNADVVLNPALKTIPSYMFQNTKITSVKIPRSVTKVEWGAFTLTALPGLLIPGPLSAASSSEYTDICPSGLLKDAVTAKVFFAGPNTKANSTITNPMFGGTTDLKAFVPANGLWDGELNAGGTRTKVIKYGPGEEIDFALDTEEKVITAKPTTEAAFTNALNWATLFRDKLGYRTRISVTNSIEVATGAVTPEMLSNVEIDSTLIMFAVKTQAQLDSVLDAVPQTTMLAIDPTGATERLDLPQDRALWVWLSGNGEYRPYVRGLVITFH